MFLEWQKNTLYNIKQLQKDGKDIPNKQIKKIMLKGYTRMMTLE